MPRFPRNSSFPSRCSRAGRRLPVLRARLPSGRTRRGRMPLGVVLFLHPGRLLEGLALIEDTQGGLRKGSIIIRGRRPLDLPLHQVLEHPHPLDAHAQVNEAPGEPRDGQVPRRIAEPAVLPLAPPGTVSLAVMAATVLVLGAGFGGLELSSRLAHELGGDVDVTLIDRTDAFVFGFSKLDVMFGRRSMDEVRLPYAE